MAGITENRKGNRGVVSKKHRKIPGIAPMIPGIIYVEVRAKWIFGSDDSIADE